MGVSYKKLWIHLIEKNMKRTYLIKLTGITSNTLANMVKDEYISMKNLEKICKAMNLIPSDKLKFVED
ncbi:DNA-binding helix-turn-helix protein [Peptostreptococcaceae bacterium AS15]|nr:DNA-binding helix-turn-helix protein [Peptostreptococcaceae bacterium AS15]